jgi:hypothetical protein
MSVEANMKNNTTIRLDLPYHILNLSALGGAPPPPPPPHTLQHNSDFFGAQPPSPNATTRTQRKVRQRQHL